MIISSDQIRQQIKDNLDSNKGIFEDKLYKTSAIKDKQFYSPTFNELMADYLIAKDNIAKDFNISDDEVKDLATHTGIYDCDNMARKLRVQLNDQHYKRYREKKHDLPYEYACLQMTDEKPDMLSGGIIRHDYCMIFSQDGICFADLMIDRCWKISEFKPNVIGIE